MDDKSKFFETLIKTLQSPTKERTKDGIEILKPLIRNVPLIKNILKNMFAFDDNTDNQTEHSEGAAKAEEILDEFCQILTCEVKQKGQTVFKYGSYGDKFYIIIGGTVSVHVPQKVEVTETIENEEDMQETHIVNKRKLKEVVRLGAPNSFGDLALIDYKPRAATIKCVDN